MRAYNRQHPEDPVRFMGDDFAYNGPELYDMVTDYVARNHPDLLDRAQRALPRPAARPSRPASTSSGT